MDTVWTTRRNLVNADKVRNYKFYSFNAYLVFIDPLMDNLYELPVIWKSPKGAFVKVMSPEDFGHPHELMLRVWRLRGSYRGVFYRSKLEALHALVVNEVDSLGSAIIKLELAVGHKALAFCPTTPPTEGFIKCGYAEDAIHSSMASIERVRESYKLYIEELKKYK